MLAVEDYLVALDWAQIHRRPAGPDRPRRCQRRRHRPTSWRPDDWIANLAEDPATPSNTSVCLKLHRSPDHGRRGLRQGGRQAAREGRASPSTSAPTATRLPASGSGAARTVETSDLEALMPWIDWAFAAEIAAQAAGGLNLRVGRNARPTQPVGRGSPRLVPIFPKGAPDGPQSPRLRQLSETAVQIFRDRGVDVDYLPKLGKDKDSARRRHRTSMTASPSARPPR